MDRASAQGSGAIYGLNHTQESRGQRSRVSLRGEIERVGREAEPKAQAWSYGGRKKHVSGRVSEGERQRRLAEMAGDAAAYDQQRRDRLQRADDREAREEACNTEADKAAHRTGRGPSFLDAASKGFYGPGSDSGASLGEALNRRAFYSERPGAD